MRTTIFACAMLFCGAAFAQDTNTEAPVDGCTVIGTLAESIMTGRQNGVPMSRMMEVAADNELVRAIVIAAYDQPRMSVDRNVQRSIADFQNDVMLQCYQALD